MFPLFVWILSSINKYDSVLFEKIYPLQIVFKMILLYKWYIRILLTNAKAVKIPSLVITVM
ncbi:hypothetical protein A8L34_01095 [Bacillus sp. FJAT-27264]|nr:hypothetical protein A8L34_01095 [Bacillus sp. FJAT-27264]